MFKFKLNQVLSIFCGLAHVINSLRIAQQAHLEIGLPGPESVEALRGAGAHNEVIEVMPWVLRPGEQPSDFAHTLDDVQFSPDAPIVTNTSKTNSTNATNTGNNMKTPTTAILLVGKMHGWEAHVDAMLSGMVYPNNADIFIHTSDVVDESLMKLLGGNLKRYVGNISEHSICHSWNNQFFNFEEAFKIMSDYEQTHGLTYDVVVRARSDVVPVPPAWLNLEEWRDKGRLHMMTDMIFWGRRDDMAKIANTYSEAKSYYEQHQDPYKRPIAVASLLDTFLRDPFVHRTKQDSWRFYQKLETLPYPDMGEKGAIANLQKAMGAGMMHVTFQGNDTCAVSHGDVYNPFDYRLNALLSEKDLLDWVLVHGLTICDVGSSMNRIRFKGKTLSRELASDCSIKSSWGTWNVKRTEER
jgi:hypothetical protein